ncbi:MAG TPA: class I SAM-dependent methyltransferase [Vicinamibacterales bacterium]
MADVDRVYIPAAGQDWCLPFYDSFTRLIGAEEARQTLIDHAALQPGHRVLDVGCGTGSLLMQIASAHPQVQLTGLDPDPKALARAQRKADKAGIAVQLDRGYSDALPYPDRSFDRVLSSFMFHHLLGRDQKLHTMREIARVLAPGGRLLLLDMTPPTSDRGGFLVRWMHSSPLLSDNAEDRVLAYMREGGLVDPRVIDRSRLFLVFRTAYYEARA